MPFSVIYPSLFCSHGRRLISTCRSSVRGSDSALVELSVSLSSESNEMWLSGGQNDGLLELAIGWQPHHTCKLRKDGCQNSMNGIDYGSTIIPRAVTETTVNYMVRVYQPVWISTYAAGCHDATSMCRLESNALDGPTENLEHSRKNPERRLCVWMCRSSRRR